MSYTPTEWKTGDIVTAEKLNNLEIGVSDAQLPTYTTSDIGKSLTVVQGTETVTVVPEQTVVTNQDVTLDNGATILHNAAELMGVEFTLENGPDVLNGVGSIEGEPTSMPLEKTIHGYRLTGEFPLQVMYYEADTGKWYFAWQTSAEVTLSATASIPSASSVGWEKSGGTQLIVVNKKYGETAIEFTLDESSDSLENALSRLGNQFTLILNEYEGEEINSRYQFPMMVTTANTSAIGTGFLGTNMDGGYNIFATIGLQYTDGNITIINIAVSYPSSIMDK